MFSNINLLLPNNIYQIFYSLQMRCIDVCSRLVFGKYLLHVSYLPA